MYPLLKQNLSLPTGNAKPSLSSSFFSQAPRNTQISIIPRNFLHLILFIFNSETLFSHVTFN